MAIIKNSDNPNPPIIICCVDTSNASEITLRYACYKAKINGFAIRALAVTEASHKNLLFGSKAIGNEKRHLVEQHLTKLIEKISKETGVTPTISIREGDIVTEITREIKFTPNCAMLVFGKSISALSDNTVLPKITQKIGNKIRVPITIVPENLSLEYLQMMS